MNLPGALFLRSLTYAGSATLQANSSISGVTLTLPASSGTLAKTYNETFGYAMTVESGANPFTRYKLTDTTPAVGQNIGTLTFDGIDLNDDTSRGLAKIVAEYDSVGVAGTSNAEGSIGFYAGYLGGFTTDPQVKVDKDGLNIPTVSSDISGYNKNTKIQMGYGQGYFRFPTLTTSTSTGILAHTSNFNQTFSGAVTFANNVTCGNATTDIFTFKSRYGSSSYSFTPETDGHSLGTSSLRWDGHFTRCDAFTKIRLLADIDTVNNTGEVEIGTLGDLRLYTTTTGLNTIASRNNTVDLAFGYGASGTIATTEFLMDMGTGDFHADGNILAYSTTTASDIKLKKDLVKLDNAVEKVQQINGYDYTLKKDESRRTGVIAQEVEKVLPNAVYDAKSLKGEEGETHKVVDYNSIIALLVESVKELKAEIEELKNASSN